MKYWEKWTALNCATLAMVAVSSALNGDPILAAIIALATLSLTGSAYLAGRAA